MVEKRISQRGRIANLLLERTDRLKFQSALEVGCGRGDFLNLLLAKYPGICACGLDLSERKIICAADKLGRRAELSVGDVENMPYSDGSFDLLLCGNSIRRCLNPARAFNQFYRVLRKGGTLILFGYGRTPARRFLAETVSRYGGETGRRYSSREIRGFLEYSAFRKIEWEVPFRNVYVATGVK